VSIPIHATVTLPPVPIRRHEVG